MAEAIFRHQVDQAGLARIITTDSAGTGAWHLGNPPHIGTRRILLKHGLTTAHLGRVVTQNDFTRFDYLIAMDRDNLRDLRSMGGGAMVRVALLMDFAGGHGTTDIPDPYYDGRFAETYTLIEQGCRGLLNQIIDTFRLTRTSP
jgi:protein-tyrosine phosphatase